MGAVGHRVDSGRIGALVRNPEGAAGRGIKRNAPRVHQIWVRYRSESGEVRDQIRLNVDGRIGGVGGHRVSLNGANLFNMTVSSMNAPARAQIFLQQQLRLGLND